MNLLKEAVNITKDLNDVVFIGSIAVFAHIGPHRQTRDIDFAIASTISDEDLLRKGYQKWKEGKEVWYSPNHVKIDFFRKDVGRIEVSKIFSTSVAKSVGQETIRVMSLEVLLLSKLRAGRDQDIQDIQEICKREGKKIKLERISDVATLMEITDLKNTITAFGSGSRKSQVK